MPHMPLHPGNDDRLPTALAQTALEFSAPPPGDDLQQRTLCSRDHLLQLEILDDPTAGSKITRMTLADRFCKVKYGSRKLTGISRWHDPTGLADQVGGIPNRRDDAGQPAGHRFSDDVWKAFAERRG
jgi:hypothetical protein